MGRDGSRLECPRTPELERGLGQAGKNDAARNVWLTAIVHLPTGPLWSWRLRPGAAAEQERPRSLRATLAPEALIVRDAAYMAFELVRVQSGGSAELERRNPPSAWRDRFGPSPIQSSPVVPRGSPS